MFPAKTKKNAGWQTLHLNRQYQSYTKELEKCNQQRQQLAGELIDHESKHPWLLKRTRGKTWINGKEFACWVYPVELRENHHNTKIRKLARKNVKVIEDYIRIRSDLLEVKIYIKQLQSLLAQINYKPNA